jgi:uncharacterized protein YoxC
MTFVEFLETLLPILLYISGIVLLVVLIMIGIRFIRTMDKVESIVKDVDNKVKSLNGVFHLIDTTTDKLSLLTDRVVDGVTAFVINMFSKKYNKKEEEDSNEEE